MLDILGKHFGFEKNKKGYKVLPSYIRVIQGDGVSYESLDSILKNMEKHRWSADNLAFGSGGALLQKLNRDTQKCAYKCSYAIVNGKGVGILNLVMKIFLCVSSHSSSLILSILAYYPDVNDVSANNCYVV